MDKQNNSQFNNKEQPLRDSLLQSALDQVESSKVKSKLPKFLMPTLVGIVILILSIGGILFVKNNGFLNKTTLTNTSADFTKETEATLKIYVDSNLKYLKLGGKYYDLNKSPEDPLTEVPSVTWVTVLETWKDLGKTAKIFDYKVFPNSSALIFTLALDPTLGENETMVLYKTYSYNSKRAYLNNNKKALLVFESIWSYSHNYSVPKIGEMSKDGQYLTLYVYGCWNCGGHTPETHIIDLIHFDNNYKNLGKIGEVIWEDNGAYSYKDETGKIVNGSLKYPVEIDPELLK